MGSKASATELRRAQKGTRLGQQPLRDTSEMRRADIGNPLPDPVTTHREHLKASMRWPPLGPLFIQPQVVKWWPYPAYQYILVEKATTKYVVIEVPPLARSHASSTTQPSAMPASEQATQPVPDEVVNLTNLVTENKVTVEESKATEASAEVLSTAWWTNLVNSNASACSRDSGVDRCPTGNNEKQCSIDLLAID